MSRHTLRDESRNEYIRKGIGFTNIEKKIKVKMVWLCTKTGIIQPIRKIES